MNLVDACVGTSSLWPENMVLTRVPSSRRGVDGVLRPKDGRPAPARRQLHLARRGERVPALDPAPHSPKSPTPCFPLLHLGLPGAEGARRADARATRWQKCEVGKGVAFWTAVRSEAGTDIAWPGERADAGAVRSACRSSRTRAAPSRTLGVEYTRDPRGAPRVEPRESATRGRRTPGAHPCTGGRRDPRIWSKRSTRCSNGDRTRR